MCPHEVEYDVAITFLNVLNYEVSQFFNLNETTKKVGAVNLKEGVPEKKGEILWNDMIIEEEGMGKEFIFAFRFKEGEFGKLQYSQVYKKFKKFCEYNDIVMNLGEGPGKVYIGFTRY